MDEMKETELSADERDAMRRLSRDKMPSRQLEARTIAELRSRGLLRTARPAFPVSWRIAAALAAVALFGSGLVVGQSIATETSVTPATLTHENEALATAAEVQHAGTAYVNALAAVAEAADSADTASMTQAREVALAAFWGAANEIVRIAPDDPLAGQVVRGFERKLLRQTGDKEEARHVIWF